MRVLTLVILLLTVRPAIAPAQPQLDPIEAYDVAVRRYVSTGDVARALDGIRGWSVEQLEVAIPNYAVRPDAALREAAVLQLEIALRTVVAAPGLAATHLDLGESLIRSARERLPQAAVTAFADRWYGVAASMFLTVNNTVRAGRLIGHGLQLAPASVGLVLLRGIAVELDAMGAESGAWSVSATGLRRGSLQRVRELLAAEQEYRRILNEQPSFARARVRLGRVLAVVGRTVEAQAELERAQQDAEDSTEQYLAAMFLGSLHEDRGDLAKARESFERALSIAPASHAATAALGYLEVMAGRADRAHALARSLLSQPAAADPWWAYRNGGLEQASLAWLREQVRR